MKIEEVFEKALMLIKLKDYDEAEKIVRQLVKVKPDNEGFFLTLGNIYSLKNERKKALRTYIKASKIAPKNPDCYSNIGVMYKQIGKNQQAIHYLKKALSFAKNRADIYYNLGNVYKQSGSLGDAEHNFLEAVRLNPEFVQCYNNLGTLYIEQGMVDKAEDIIRKGLEVDENHPGLLYNMGVLRDSQGSIDEAIGLYKHALVNQPLWVDSLNNLGIAYNKTNLHGKAIKVFSNALDIEPENYRVKNNIATAYKSIGEEKKARQFYREAISHNPGYTRASLNLSELYRETGDLDSAIEELNRIETIRPEDSEIKVFKAHVYIDKGEDEKAESIIDSVMQSSPGNPAPLALKALFCIRKGEIEKAEEYIEKADSIKPGSLPLKMAKAEFYRSKGELGKAEGELSGILSENPGSLKVSLELARVLKEQEKYDDALKILDSLKGDYGDFRETVAEYSDIYKKSGQTEKALEYSNRLLAKMGQDGDQIDIDSLNRGIALFEENSKSYELLNSTRMEERLNDFVREYVKQEQEKNLPQDAMSFLIGSVDGLNDEEVPVLDVGGIEPVIEINEEEETHLLDTLEEDFDPEDDAGFFEETEDKIRKEVMENIEKTYPQLQQPNYPLPVPVIIPQVQSAPPPPVTVPPRVYDNLYSSQERQPPQYQMQPPQLPEAPPPQKPPAPQTKKKPDKPAPEKPPVPGSPEKKHEVDDLLDKFEGVEEPEGLSFVGLKSDPEYVNSDISNLLEYLEGLTDFLIEARKKKYTRSIMKLKVETLKLKLRGNKGLLTSLAEKGGDLKQGPDDAAGKAAREADNGSKPLSSTDIENTLSYIKGLTGFLPENSGGVAIKLKLQNLLGRIEGETDGQ